MYANLGASLLSNGMRMDGDWKLDGPQEQASSAWLFNPCIRVYRDEQRTAFC